MKDNTEKKLSLKRFYAKDKFFFRLMIVIFMFTIGVIFGMIMIGMTRKYFIQGFVACAIVAYISLFTIGQVLYFTCKSFLKGSKRELFYLRLTMVFSIVITMISTFIAAINLRAITTGYDGDGVEVTRTVAEHIDYYGVWRTIKIVNIIPNMTTVFVAAISCASVWIIYLSLFWISRGLDRDDTE